MRLELNAGGRLTHLLLNTTISLHEPDMGSDFQQAICLHIAKVTSAWRLRIEMSA